MKFQHHLFISYAHVDNKPTSDEDKGWVSRFHECLESYLSHSVGQEARIWRDTKLRGNDEFGPEIEENLPKSAILLSVLSPRYLESKWCVREVNTFCQEAKQNLGLNVGNRVRVFKVMTRSLDRSALKVFPDLSDKSMGYEFFQQDEREREAWLDPAMGSGEEYRRRIYYLADEIAELIRSLEQQAGDVEKPSSENQNQVKSTATHIDVDANKPAVYLAECSHDQRVNRENIAGSLRGHGYRILPEQRMPEFEDEYVAAVTEMLAECQLSVHLVGSSYGLIPDGPASKSNVVLQNEIAAQHSQTSDIKRLIWMPTNLQTQNSKQTEFVEQLQQTSEAQLGADLIEGDLETLKSSMHRSLLEMQKPVVPVAEKSNSEKIVYVVCAQIDRGDTLELRKFLTQQGYQVKIPVFEGDAGTVRKANEANFNTADAVLIFYGAADEAWRATTVNELRRMSGLRENSQLDANFTYLSGAETIDKTELLELHADSTINALSGFSETILTDFLAALR